MRLDFELIEEKVWSPSEELKTLNHANQVPVLVEENGDDDVILPLGANRVLTDVVDALKEEIDRASDYEEYDPG